MEPYLGEIRLFPFSFAPRGWHLCDGAILQVNQYNALYSLLGPTYGGDGKTNFALPDLRGRTPLNSGQNAKGSNYTLGSKGGIETETLTIAEIAPHQHALAVKNANGTANEPADILAIPTTTVSGVTIKAYNTATAPSTTLNPATLSNAGSNTAHNNMQPYLTLNFCIAMTGIYPTRE